MMISIQFSTILILILSMVSCKSGDPSTPTEPKEETINIEPFKANRILIKHGLQLQCWLATDNFELGGKAGQPAYIMNPDDWKLTGFTAPTFFGPPLMNTSFFINFPNSQWAIAKAPYGDHMERGPSDMEKQNGFLSKEQKAHLSRLITICFGDEEYYNYQMLPLLKEWFDVTRKFYPDVLVHNNQYANQWSENQMRTYIHLAKPDIITYDWYYFHSWDDNNYIGAKDMAEHLKIYRDLSLEGLDGNGNDYLAFGQYTQGFVNEGTYKLTESQLRLYYYMTWTFGGKWLNWFRYLQGDGYGGQTAPTEWSLLLEQGMPGQPTKYMEWVNRCNQESKYIGDYLVRLKTNDVFYLPGSSKYTEGKPNKISAFTADSFVKEITANCINDMEESGDIYIGFFDIIPQEEQGDPGFFNNKTTDFFMITNGLASKLEERSVPLSQNIKVSIDFSLFPSKKLFWINPKTGDKDELSAITIDGEKIFQVSLEGGSGALFIVE